MYVHSNLCIATMAPNLALAQVVFDHLTMERVDAKTRTGPSSLEEPTVFKDTQNAPYS